MIGAVVLIAFVFPLVAPDEAAIERIRGQRPQSPPSAIHRLANWRFAAERIGDRPLLGWGMDASRALPGGKSLINDLYPGGDDQQPCASLAAPCATTRRSSGLSFGIWQARWLSTLWLGAALLARLGAGPQGPAFQPDRWQPRPRQAHV
jgi:hypothetical protein